MKTFSLMFYGRQVNSLGYVCRCFRDVEANTLEDAKLRLYETHEHISEVKVLNEEETVSD